MVNRAQSDYRNMAEYGEVIKKGAAKYTEIGNLVPATQLFLSTRSQPRFGTIYLLDG